MVLKFNQWKDNLEKKGYDQAGINNQNWLRFLLEN